MDNEKKKKKKYPYDPKKYSMPVPDGFDPSLLTPTGKIDGRKLKSIKNRQLAEELLQASGYDETKLEEKKRQCQMEVDQDTSISPDTQSAKKSTKSKSKKNKEEEARKKEEEAQKKAQLQAELAKEREAEAKRKKEAAALARQLERQKKEEERKRAAAFLQNWEKKCEDLERDDLRKLPEPIPIICDIPEKLFGDALFILESLYNLHDLYKLHEVFPDGISYETLEEILLDQHEEGALNTILQFLLRTIFDKQSTGQGYGIDEDTSHPAASGAVTTADNPKTDGTNQTIPGAPTTTNNNHSSSAASNPSSDTSRANTKTITTSNDNNNHKPQLNGFSDHENHQHHNHDVSTNHVTNGVHSDEEEVDDDHHDHHHVDEEEEDDKEVRMNDLIGAAIKAAQDVRQSLTKPLPEHEIDSSNITELLRLHLLQSGSFPKGRTIYNGWYSSREDPGLWLCMEEPDLIRKLSELTIFDLDIEDRIKILHTLIYQMLSFIQSRQYIESASDELVELRKKYRHEAASFGRWDRENCVKRLQDTDQAQQNTTLAEGEEPPSAEELERRAQLQQQNQVDYDDYQREKAIRQEQLNELLLQVRSQIRNTQAVYGIHPIGRDRAHRRYWIFQSLSGLFVEQDDEYLGKCLDQPTPLESQYKKLFDKDNPLMHSNPEDMIQASDVTSYCTSNLETCAVHGQARGTEPRWWFYNTPESLDTLVECLNKRGFRESKLHEILSTEISLIKPMIEACPAYLLNKNILEQSGIRRSRRLRTRGGKRRGRKDYD